MSTEKAYGCGVGKRMLGRRSIVARVPIALLLSRQSNAFPTKTTTNTMLMEGWIVERRKLQNIEPNTQRSRRPLGAWCWYKPPGKTLGGKKQTMPALVVDCEDRRRREWKQLQHERQRIA